MQTKLDRVGIGNLWGVTETREHPVPFPPGTPVGRYLVVERPTRLTGARAFYLVNNQSAKWNHRYCWSCGHRYTPNTANSCEYCQTPLRDELFLMAARWDRSRFQPFSDFAQARLRHRGLVSPVAILMKQNQLLTVHHYHGEALLIDEVAPVSSPLLLRWLYRLSDTLGFLQSRGVELADMAASQVLIMPDHTVRWFDLDVRRVHENSTPPRAIIAAQVRRLGEMIGPYGSAADPVVQKLLGEIAAGRYPDPFSLCDAIAGLFGSYSEPAVPQVAAMSDVGLVRRQNEDSWAWRMLDGATSVVAVADGMGGLERGAEASALAISVAMEVLTSGWGEAKAEALLSKAMREANKAVLDRRRSLRQAMGTTLVLWIQQGRRAWVAHAGDSRAYLLAKSQLSQVTQDHSLVAELIHQKKITPAEADNHPMAHALWSWIGGEDDFDFDTKTLTLDPGDRVLLCTDGLTDRSSAKRLEQYLRHIGPRRELVRALIQEGLAFGGHDNITAVVLDVE
ncbi:MAG: serine/threonine-protein phosphatase [Deltaproteobacteria bacterium]|nr:serine/threonine-protein phosphatase [Deltaproteobacteria bacterium]